MSKYAMLQLFPDKKYLPNREHIKYLISLYMDSKDLIPCPREAAERIVYFSKLENPRGQQTWAIFDDEIDRLNIRELDGIGKSLTKNLPGMSHAVGVMGQDNTRLLRLYRSGRTVDTYITAPGSLGRVGRFIACHGRAVRWRLLLKKQQNVMELGDAFLKGEQDAVSGFEEIIDLIGLHNSCRYGFASANSDRLPEVATLYFCSTTHVRQQWYNRLFQSLFGKEPSAEIGTSVNVKNSKIEKQ